MKLTETAEVWKQQLLDKATWGSSLLLQPYPPAPPEHEASSSQLGDGKVHGATTASSWVAVAQF